MKAESFSKAG